LCVCPAQITCILSYTYKSKYSSMQFYTASGGMESGERALQHTATYCNILQHTVSRGVEKAQQHTATYCNILQHTATYCNTLQHTATHCNTLQHTATHGNTRQHTATHGNTQNLEMLSVLQCVAVCCSVFSKEQTAKECQAASQNWPRSQQPLRLFIYELLIY